MTLFDWASEMGEQTVNTVCSEVVKAVAEVEGIPPREIDFALHDHIPTGALEELDQAERGQWEFNFDVPRHEVTVQSDGAILVDGQVIQPDP